VKTGYNGDVKVWLGRISALSSRARVVLVVFVVLGCGAGVWLVAKMGGGASAPPDNRDAARGAARAAQVAALTRDQDMDGLKDWEEAIFRTDPAIADTDADGTTDGEEIEQGRDATKPNTSADPQRPDDIAATLAPFISISEDVLNPALNMTEQFSRSLLPDIVGPILSGKSPQTGDLVRKASTLDFLQNPERIWVGAKQYSTADITLSPKNDLATIAQMFLALNHALIRHTTTPSDGQEVIINFIQNPASEEARSSLLAYQNTFGGLARDIIKTPVPQEYASVILAYLNTLSKIHYSLGLITNLENDPISALISIKALPQAQEEFSVVVAKAQNESKKIVERKVKELNDAQRKNP